MSGPHKLCPRCRTPAGLEAPQCGRCGHAYRTQFVEPERTQMVYGPPAASPRRRYPWWPWVFLLTGGLIVAACLWPLVREALRQEAEEIAPALRALQGKPAPATSVPPPLASNPAATPPATAPQGGLFDAPLPPGWKETPQQQEQPVVEVTSLSGRPAVLRLEGEGGAYALNIPGGGSDRVTLPAGQYQFQLQGSRYRQTGVPDQTGTFTCRRYRLYSLEMIALPAELTPQGIEIGDQ